jgi:hypothetical protein
MNRERTAPFVKVRRIAIVEWYAIKNLADGNAGWRR